MAERATGWGPVAGEILRGLAHDMNNRLLALVGLRELAGEGALDAELLQLFDDELERLETTSRLVRRLGEAPGHQDVAEARVILETVRDLHTLNAGLRGVRTDWSIPAGLPAVRTDGVAAERWLLEVLASSGRAAADADVIARVAARGEGGALLVEIAPFPRERDVPEAPEAAGLTHHRTDHGLEARFRPA